METVVLVLCWLGVLQSSLLGFYFLTGTSRLNSNFFLGTALLLISIRAAKSTLFIFTDQHSEYLFNLGFAAHAAIGPSILLYLRSLKKEWTFKRIDTLHFFPSLFIVFATPVVTLDNFWYKGGYGVLLCYTLFYSGLYCFVLYRNLKDSKPVEGLSVPWIILLTGTVTVFQTAYFTHYVLCLTSYSAAPVLYAIALYFISYAVLKNNMVFLSVIKQKYQNLKVSDEDLKKFRNKILDIMENKRPFLDNNFSLKKLSDMTSIPQHVLSHTFSMEFQESFTNFINRYRIEESKRILRNPGKDYLSIAGIAFESGFNSISSFNVSFKKHIGVTPSAFKKGARKTLSVMESI
jgi:AraC-like DNA-binding protein